jgi:spore coat protein CotH
VKTQELPLISISEPGKLNWYEKVPCDVWYVDGKDSVFLTAGIKMRGGSSSRLPKHSFAFELDNKFPLCGLPKNDDWILNANYIDKTFMRHKLNFDLFRQMHPENLAPKSAFVRLEMNGDYYGLFVLMQEMNAGNLGLKKKNDGAMLFKEPPVFFEKKKDADTHENYYQQKFPKLAKVDKTKELSRLHDFILLSSDFDFQSEINSWFDMRNLVDWYLILQLSFNSDGITKNFILYKTEEKIPFRIALWDYDHSFGRDGDNEKNKMNTPMNMKKSVLFRRLLEIKSIGFEEMVQKRWSELRKAGVFSTENLFSKMDEMDAQIKLEQTKNFTRWPVKSEWYFDANSYEQEVEWMKKSIRKRIAQLDKKYNV